MLTAGYHSAVALAVEGEWLDLLLGGRRASTDSVRDSAGPESAAGEAVENLGKAPVFPSSGASPRTLHNLHSGAVPVVAVAQRFECALEDVEAAVEVGS